MIPRILLAKLREQGVTISLSSTGEHLCYDGDVPTGLLVELAQSKQELIALLQETASSTKSTYPLTLSFPANAHIAVPEGQWERKPDDTIVATFRSQSELAWCLVVSGTDRPEALAVLK
jgi:hypothetical protein